MLSWVILFFTKFDYFFSVLLDVNLRFSNFEIWLHIFLYWHYFSHLNQLLLDKVCAVKGLFFYNAQLAIYFIKDLSNNYKEARFCALQRCCAFKNCFVVWLGSWAFWQFHYHFTPYPLKCISFQKIIKLRILCLSWPTIS